MANYSTDDTRWSTERVMPDPSALAAIGAHHSFATSLADLVDNSIDAGASQVRIRFVQRGTEVLGLQIIDNGRGMSPAGIARAMTFGGRRQYDDHDLGHFGLGLKAASLSQAFSFEVYSRQEWGQAVGRRMDQEVTQNFSVGVMDEESANERLDSIAGIDIAHGTVVDWRGIKDTIHTSDRGQLKEWRSEKLRTVREHLGLVFHRHIQLDKIHIDVDAVDMDRNRVLPPTRVDAIDPFADSATRDGYPRKYNIDLPNGASCTFEAHVFPPNLNSSTFDLAGEPGEARQGVYLYRRERLLTGGENWAGIRQAKKELGLGRIKIDLDVNCEEYITLNPEKIAPLYAADFTRSLARAHTIEGQLYSIDDYFVDLQRIYRDAKKSKPHVMRLVEPGAGLSPKVVSSLDNLQCYSDVDPIDLRFTVLPSDELFRADRSSRRIDINLKLVRKIYGSKDRLSSRDGQLLKAFLYFLLESDFKVEQRWTAQREDRHRLLNDILMMALQEDLGNEDLKKTGGDVE